MSTDSGPRRAPDISVIMPVYNARDTLRRAVESIRHQMGPSIELICVDDASTDDSASRLETWYAGDSRVRLIRLERNLGPGAARNAGLEAARGEYVLFADADDMVMRGALARLHTLALLHDSDIVKGTFENVFEDGKRKVVVSATTPGPDVETTCLRDSKLLQKIPVSHCTYFFRRGFLLDHDLRYPPDLLVGEDLVFIAQALIAAERVTLTPQVILRFYLMPTSLTRPEKPNPEALLGAIEHRRRVSRLLREQGLIEAAHGYLKHWNYQAEAYWVPMARQWTLPACSQVFEAFRQVISEDGLPWLDHTPATHQYLLALLSLGEDERAIEFLRSGALTRGFATPEDQRSAATLVARVAS
ncbi:MAG: glycosyltransferase family 2 protein [Xanthomonadales bacterium]|jgi:glycosyltransferase involved in cell wall biosynthesis|nr:glycosyltransferase family 2 protein [Xanthomonadales bacterium]